MEYRVISKEEAHDFINKADGNKVMLFSFNKKKGKSNLGKRIKKTRGKELIDQATLIILSEAYFSFKIDLFEEVKGNIVSTLLLAKRNEIT